MAKEVNIFLESEDLRGVAESGIFIGGKDLEGRIKIGRGEGAGNADTGFRRL